VSNRAHYRKSNGDLDGNNREIQIDSNITITGYGLNNVDQKTVADKWWNIIPY
jgi:hypothetical protein